MLRKLILLIFALGPIVPAYCQFQNFRAPAYPLITHDPYFSIWSSSQVPTEGETVHWTQKPMPINSMVRIDGKVYRLMGNSPAFVPAAYSTGTDFTPTRTTFSYSQDGVEIQLGFLSPLLLDDLDLVSRPLSYVSWNLVSKDGKKHDAEIYFDISGLATVNQKSQRIVWNREKSASLDILKMGSKDQPILKKSGDDLRIDWGYLYVAVPRSEMPSSFAGRSENAVDAFYKGTPLPEMDDLDEGKRVAELDPVLAFTIPVKITPDEPVEKHAMVAYDDLFSVEYFGKELEGYWKKKISGPNELLQVGDRDYSSIKNRCSEFDENLLKKAESIGGSEYAAICALAYRQCMAAHKIVKDENGNPLCFSKENFSNGSMGTVDVFYPASPFFLYFNPELMKAQTTPIFDYAESGRWPWPYAPHDIGKYPLGNGQKYGGGEKSEDRQMPVEECGNMLILTAAIAKVEGNANYASSFWQTITQWAEYLNAKGFDPENQLCTDDFAGHLAHNTNLSIKAIMGLASYGMLCEMKGLKKKAATYKKAAKELAAKWIKEADDGDHFRLAFDKPGTWSQKYNMVWDDILGFNLFPEEIKNKEIAFYLSHQNRYGLPLDSRDTYTKLDWILWTASLANTDQQFRELVKPVYDFLNETPDRVPMTDWYWTKSGKMRGFIARSVVGGVFMELLKKELTP